MTSPVTPEWSLVSPDRFRSVLMACASATLPPNIALLHLVIAAEGPQGVEAALREAREAARRVGESVAAERLSDARELWTASPEAFGTIRAVLGSVDHGGEAAPEEGVARWAETFDRLAGRGGGALRIGEPRPAASGH